MSSLFDAGAMVRQAEQQTGLDDWGDDGFRKPLRILCHSLNREARLSAEGFNRTGAHLENILEQRLRLVGDRKRYPEIEQQEIRQPLFMTGMPRAGTSLLNSLVAQDRDNLPTYHWQMWCPSPPPNDPRFDHREQIEQAGQLLDYQGYTTPEMRERHHYAALNAEEDGHLCEYSLLSNNFTAYWNVPTYHQYVANVSYVPAYQWHKRALQALQLGAHGRRWTLKAPGHLYDLHPLLEVYPDAMFVMNHRDPAKVVASVMSLISVHFRMFGNGPLTINRDFVLAYADVTAAAWDNAIRMREDPELQSRFLDIHYLDLEQAPIAQVERVYAHLGQLLSIDTCSAMAAFFSRNRKHKFGGHTYSLSDYDIRPDEIRERFSGYIAFFNVEVEA